MRFRFSPEVETDIKKLKSKSPKAFELLKKQLVLFENDSTHPSLRIHKLSGKMHGVWSLSIGLKLRLLFFVKDGEAWGYAIGTHDEVYRK